MIDDVDRFINAESPEPARRSRQRHPTGMEPGVRIDSDGRGEAVAVVPPGQAPEWRSILERHGFADVIDVLDVVEVRSWECWSSAEGRLITLQYVKARVARRRSDADAVDVKALIKETRKRRHTPPLVEAHDRSLVVCLADWQAGKRTGGGITALVERIMSLKRAVKDRINALSRAGRPVGDIVVACMGDLVEACDGHYPMQSFGVELDRREQCRAVRRLLVELIVEWARLAPVRVAAVPGNHGEHRKNGKAFTAWGDNDDVAVVEQAAEVVGAIPDLAERVDFVVPDQELTLTLDLHGTIVALAHGHQARGGSSPQARTLRWWRHMAHTRHPVGDADVLVTGHYHHLEVHADGTHETRDGRRLSRTWMLCPALDGGSPWWEHQGGGATDSGTLTFVAGGGGWSDLEVLR